jgi:hypothetical protein
MPPVRANAKSKFCAMCYLFDFVGALRGGLGQCVRSADNEFMARAARRAPPLVPWRFCWPGPQARNVRLADVPDLLPANAVYAGPVAHSAVSILANTE